jgi:hypothetical protein
MVRLIVYDLVNSICCRISHKNIYIYINFKGSFCIIVFSKYVIVLSLLLYYFYNLVSSKREISLKSKEEIKNEIIPQCVLVICDCKQHTSKSKYQSCIDAYNNCAEVCYYYYCLQISLHIFYEFAQEN